MKQQLEKIQALLARGVYAAAEHELEKLIAEAAISDNSHPRISEQDAREIGLSVIRYCNDNQNWYVDNWLEDCGVILLAKLNQDQSIDLNPDDWTKDLAL